MPEITQGNLSRAMLATIGYLVFIAGMIVCLLDAYNENPTGTFRGFVIKLAKNVYSAVVVLASFALAITVIGWLLFAGYRLLMNIVL